VMLNKKRDSLSIHLNIVGFTPVSAGIYIGAEGDNGTLLFDLSDGIFGYTIQKRVNGTMVKNNLANLMTDKLYLVIASADNPNGLIRGQLKLVTDWHYTADLKGSELVPALSTNAYGLGSVGLSLDKKRIDFKVICQNLSGAITQVKLYTGQPGTNGTEVMDLSNSVTGNVVTGSFVPNPDQVSSLLAGELYVVVGTAMYPDGQLRAQLRHQRGFTMETFSDGQQMIPTVVTDAHALGVYRLSPSMDSLFYDIVLDNITTNLDYIHLHIGYPGEEYTGLQIDFTPAISGNRVRGVMKNLSTASLTRIITSNLTLISHTVEFPGGEIRGHLNRFVHEGYTLQLDNVANATSEGYGIGYAAINNNQDRVHFAWLAGNLSSTPTAASFVHVPTNQQGTIVLDLTNNMQISDNSASGAGTWSSADTPPFLLSNAMQFDDRKIHFQLATTNNPTGELSGIMRPGMIFYNSTSSVISPNLTQASVQLSPNPAASFIRISAEQIFTHQALLKVIDGYGKTVQVQQVNTPDGRLDTQLEISSLPQGIYFCLLTDGKHGITQKFVIE
jgi:hypothetical protein